jgi:hypothetical protein
MTWLLTATGATFDLRFIAAGSISLLDVAHHLAQINRFTGACSRPYSVAEHSLLVCQLLEHAGYTSPALLQAALMHDAHEAYTSDMSSPMKQVLGNAWAAEENRIQHAVLRRFGCYTAFTAWRTPIHNADLQAARSCCRRAGRSGRLPPRTRRPIGSTSSRASASRGSIGGRRSSTSSPSCNTRGSWWPKRLRTFELSRPRRRHSHEQRDTAERRRGSA